MISSSVNVNAANYDKGWIVNLDGEKLEGLIKTFYSTDKNIEFKKNKKDKSIKFKSSELKEIGLVIEKNQDTLLFEKVKSSRYAFFGNKVKFDDDLFWSIKAYGSDKIEGYYFIVEEGNSMPMGNGGRVNRVSLSRLIGVRYPGAEHVLLLSQDSGASDPFHAYDKLLRKGFIKMIEEKCPNMVKMIEEKKYNVEDFVKLLEDYTASCN